LNPNATVQLLINAAERLTGLMMPYMLDLFYMLVLLEIVVIGINHITAEDNPESLIWGFVRLGFRAGFVWYWLQNAWALGTTIIGSFDMLGSQITGIPHLDPVTLYNVGLQIAGIVWQAPTTGGLIGDLSLAANQAIVWFTIVVVFALIAGLALLTIAAAYIILVPGSIFVTFWACRFTAPMAEGYPAWLIRTGVTILTFYIVLGIAQDIAGQWLTAVNTACAPATTMVPWDALNPRYVPVTACTQAIPSDLLMNMLGSVLLFGIIALPLPFIAASLAGHGISLGLEHAAAAYYLARNVVRPLAGAMNAGNRQVVRTIQQTFGNGSSLAKRQAAGAQAAANVRPRSSGPNAFGVRPTAPLSGGGNSPTSKVTRVLK
jgi:P-type conjugative transfer protein TrbL